MNDMHKHRYPRMVHDYYENRVRGILLGRKKRIAGIKTRAEAEKYVRDVRAAVKRVFGPMPSRTPLNSVVTGRDDCGKYILEKVIYESRPGFFVTGNFYLPKGGTGKLPCVLGLCGHSNEGKASEAYQSFCQGLATKGFAVFIIDPINQGERILNLKDGSEKVGLCHVHNLIGAQMVLNDDFFGSWRAWDAIRGLDYLLSRPEVDRSRVGVTGNSGGGTLASYVTALDPRITMAAPSCFICSYLANIENELPSDAEQNPPGIIAAGLDQVDLLLCYAPRPTMILGQFDDFFDKRHALESYEDLKKIHSLLGARDSSAVFIGPRGHGYFLENREAMYGWFMRHAGIKGPQKEKDVVPVEPKKLNVCLDGRIAGQTVFEFTAKTAAALCAGRKNLPYEELKTAAEKLLGTPGPENGAPHYRPLRGGDERPIEFAIETEPEIQAIAAVCGNNPGLTMHLPTGKVILFVGNVSSYDDAMNIKEIKMLAAGKIPLVALDPRGMGQSMPKTCGSIDFFEPYGADFLYASTAEMLAEPYLGRRVYDVLRTMDLLYANGATEVELVGRGTGAVIVSFAALLHASKPKVRIMNYLPSYSLIAESPVHKWPLSSLLRGVLKYFDLPDVYRALEKRLKMEKKWDANMRF